jgi:hypothetical protein
MGRRMLRTVRAASCRAPVYVFKLGTCTHKKRACSGWEGKAARWSAVCALDDHFSKNGVRAHGHHAGCEAVLAVFQIQLRLSAV